MNIRVPLVTALALGTLLLGCAQQPSAPELTPSEPAPKPGAQRQAPPEEPPSAPEAAAPTRAFTSDTLYALLAAEIAGSRQQFDIALSNYLQQAHQTRDPQVAARATHIARFLSADNDLLDAALLWVEVAPEDSEAQLNAASALVQSGRLQEAFELSRKLQAKGEHTLFQNIAASASEATDTQREQLIDGYLDLLETYPDHQELLIGTGLLLQQQGDLESALTLANRALKASPDGESATILKATLLNQLDRSDEALQAVVAALEDDPESLRLRLQYARLLTQHDLGLAQEQFEVLVRQDPEDPDLRLSLGIVALERGDIETAQASFESLLDSEAHASSANYYLGQLAERQGRNEEALLYYLQVEPGSDFLQATLNIMELLVDSNQLEAANDHMNRMRTRFPDQAADLYLFQARVLLQKGHELNAEALLSRALESHPTHSDLRYTRAMLYDQQNRLEATERDLRAILTYDPHNATALNALGYILTDTTDRHEEAYELIRQALALSPEEPAILDSMGWVLYNLGRPEDALPYLQEAMAAYPDQEIAAHLGEVLWHLGREDDAHTAWREGLEADPDSKLIPATKERLGVKPGAAD